MRIWLEVLKLRFVAEIWTFLFEMNARYIFAIELRIVKRIIDIRIYRPRHGGILFKLKIPFVYITNELLQKAVKTGPNSYEKINIITGKLFGKSIGGGR